jgi:Predicted glycosyltransferases
MIEKKIRKVAAIFTTYKPDPNFRNRISEIVSSCYVTIIVDNTPNSHNFPDTSGVILLQDGINKGLGSALNMGILKARELGCEFVALFDQDSTPPPLFIMNMLDNLQRLSAHGNCCIGPLLLDDALKSESGLVKLDSHDKEVSCIATSGMVFSIKSISRSDLFSEDLFLDFVDFDWCWRMRSKGWKVFMLNEVIMPHRLGIAQRRILGLTYHIPAPYRHYFQFRDTLRLLSWHHVPLYSKFRLGLILIPKIIIYPVILNNGKERLFWMMHGIKDYFRKIKGVGAARDKLTTSSDNEI